VFRLHFAAALTLTALGLAPGAAHLMELPVKLGYPANLYAAVTSTLYLWYGIAGGTVQIVAALTVASLAVRARHTGTGRLIAASAVALFASLLLWGAIVAPVNSAWASIAGAGPDVFVATYAQLRLRWEFGHVAAFVAWLAGWLGLVAAATRHQSAAEDA
jgi:hypothetical protein